MGIRSKSAVGVLAYLLAGCALPAGAQIVPTTNENGKRVFTFVGSAAPARDAQPASSAASSNRTLAARSRAPANVPEHLKRMATTAADKHQIDPALVYSMITAESSWNPSAVSVKGAQGLMQLIPATAARFGVRDPFDPAQNVEGGVKYLRWLLERYKGDLEKTLAAYNAGEGAVDRWGGVPNYAETRAYVKKVIDSYFGAGSGRRDSWWNVPRPIYRVRDAQGRLVFANE